VLALLSAVGSREPARGKTPAGKEPADDIEYADPGLARERTNWPGPARPSLAPSGPPSSSTARLVGLPVLVLSAVVWRLGRLPARQVRETSATGGSC